MALNFDSSIDPKQFKLLVFVLGLVFIYSVWEYLHSQVNNFRYQPVYGLQSNSVETVEHSSLQALPIVVAKSEAELLTPAEIESIDIESAFRELSVELPTRKREEVVESNEFTLSQQLLLNFRPVVSAVSNSGVVINGVFWSVGESIRSMPLRVKDGSVRYPVVSSVGHSVVMLNIGSENLPLKYIRN